MIDGKVAFYKKAEESLSSEGYRYFDGDRDISGKGKQHSNKPDYIAVKNKIIIIGEIKSPAEGPKSSSWRQFQKTDSDNFQAVRANVLSREKAKQLSREIGGHEIIICGQISDYYRKIGITYDLPISVSPDTTFLLGYTFPESEEENVKQAFKNCGKDIYDRINDGNGSVTYIFYPQETNPSLSVSTKPQASYCILRNYKGLFKNKFLGNTHLYFLPVPENRYLYLGLLGEIEDQKDTYTLRLVVDVEKSLLETIIDGEKRAFKDRFSIMETLPCLVDHHADGYRIKLDNKGEYLLSDMIINPYYNSQSSLEKMFLLKGKLAFESLP